MSWAEGLARIERVAPKRLILTLAALHVALHLPWIDLPPAGYHAWRQIQGLSVARNYHEEDMNLFYPRVDSRGAETGITGLEFPVVYWTIALGYQAFGEHDWVHRAVTLAWSLPAIPGAFWLAQALFGTVLAGLIGGTIVVLSPLFIYYSLTALPDAPMLGFLLLGLAGLGRAAETRRPGVIVSGFASLALAGLLKLSAAAAGPAALVLLLRGWPRFDGRTRAVTVAGSLAALAIVAAWYVWARHLSLAYHNNDFLLGIHFPFDPAIMPPVLRKVVLQWLPEVYLSYPEFALLVLGLATLVRRPQPVLAAYAGAYAFGLVLYLLAFMHMFEMHDYYMMPVLGLLMPVATLGGLQLVQSAQRSRAWAWALAIVAAAVLIIGPIRALSRFQRAHADSDLATLAPALERIITDRRDLVVVADDISPCIDLYWARRKGWSAQEDVAMERWGAMVDQGARWLISDSRALEAREDIRPFLELAGSHGKFNVFRVRPSSARRSD